MLQKLFRVIVRKRVVWTGPSSPTDNTADSSVPEDIKPPEIEEHSIEMDVSSFVEAYRISSNREAMSSDGGFTIMNESGQFTPTNTKSEFNYTTLNGLRTYAPLFAEGNEIQVYRIDTVANLANYATRNNAGSGWYPRFRGVIRGVKHGTSDGHDSLELTASDVLSRALKKPFVRTYSPVARSGSLIPGNAFYSLGTMSSAVGLLRTLNSSGVMNDRNGDRSYGSLSDSSVGGIPANLLASTLFWDKEDVYYRGGHFLSPAYFTHPKFDSADELTDPVGTEIAVTSDTATSVFGLNGTAWHLVSGTCLRSTSEKFIDESGSMRLSGATLRAALYKVPTGVGSTITIPMKLSAGESITVSLKTYVWNLSTLTGSVGTTLFTQTVSGPFTFNPATLGGTLLNYESGLNTAIEWRQSVFNLDSTLITSELYQTDANFIGANPFPQPASNNTVTLLRFEISGTGYIDLPRWEFNSIDVGPNLEMKITDNNILGYHSLERWVSEDGIVFRDPHPEHRMLMKKNIRVVLRNLAVPYACGTDAGYAPVHMNHRNIPTDAMYERDLVEGTDYEVLYDKGAIQLAHSHPRGEIFVAHSFIDMRASQHMEASNLIKLMLIHGAGIPEYKRKADGTIDYTKPNIILEPTGVIMQKVVIDASTNMSIQKALKDILEQLPGNYHLYADGDARVIGRFIQQSGSPRIFNPIIQTPIKPLKAGLTAGQEAWYTVTALMPDGKETMPSNLLSTVEYMNYYDAKHASIVDGRSCPALRIKPVPNQVGLVIRRAIAHKTAEETNTSGAISPWAAWYLNNSFSVTGHGATFGNTSGFQFQSLIDIVSDVQ